MPKYVGKMDFTQPGDLMLVPCRGGYILGVADYGEDGFVACAGDLRIPLDPSNPFDGTLRGPMWEYLPSAGLLVGKRFESLDEAVGELKKHRTNAKA